MALRPPESILRLNRPEQGGAVRIGPRKVYILPTRYGVIFGMLLILLLFGSMNYGNNPAFMLTFLLVGLGLVAIIHTWRNLVSLEITSGRANPVFAGQEARFEIRLINRRQGERPSIQLQLPEATPVQSDVEADASATLILHRPTERRGLQPLGRFAVATEYPLGLLRAWSYVELESTCLVYPRPGESMPASDLPDYTHSAQGDKGVGVDDFVGIRAYRPGDSPKHISWKALAREQGLRTKQFGGDRSDRLWLDWSALEGMDSESRLSRLCRGILDACERQQEFGLRLPGKEIQPGRGAKHRDDCLAALALFGEPQ
jgi:uncharacterized protein (DUF58 family)